MRLRNVEHVQEGGEYPRERSEVPGSDVLTRSAMPRQVEGDHPVSLGEARLREQPVVEVAAEAVDQDHGSTLVLRAGLQVADHAPTHLDDDGLRRRLATDVFAIGGKLRLEFRDERVDLALGHGRVRRQRQSARRPAALPAQPRRGGVAPL